MHDLLTYWFSSTEGEQLIFFNVRCKKGHSIWSLFRCCKPLWGNGNDIEENASGQVVKQISSWDNKYLRRSRNGLFRSVGYQLSETIARPTYIMIFLLVLISLKQIMAFFQTARWNFSKNHNKKTHGSVIWQKFTLVIFNGENFCVPSLRNYENTKNVQADKTNFIQRFTDLNTELIQLPGSLKITSSNCLIFLPLEKQWAIYGQETVSN